MHLRFISLGNPGIPSKSLCYNKQGASKGQPPSRIGKHKTVPHTHPNNSSKAIFKQGPKIRKNTLPGQVSCCVLHQESVLHRYPQIPLCDYPCLTSEKAHPHAADKRGCVPLSPVSNPPQPVPASARLSSRRLPPVDERCPTPAPRLQIGEVPPPLLLARIPPLKPSLL